MLRRTQPHRRNRRKLDPSNVPPGTSCACVLTVATTTLTLTFSNAVKLSGIPESLTVATVTLSDLVQVSPTVYHITLSASGAGKAYSLGNNDPAIRTYNGGYCAAVAGTFP